MQTKELDKQLLYLESFLQEQNAPTQVFGALANITNQLDSIKQENTDLSEAHRSKERFIECISHEIRTPLHYIINFADLGKLKASKNKDSKYQGYFDSIIGSGYKLLSLIEDLITLSDMASNNCKFYMHSDDIRSLIKQTCFRYKTKCQEKNITLELSIPDKTLFIEMDSQKITKALSILIENAIKFSQEGAIIHVNTQEEDSHFLIVVKDQGPGIPEQELQEIFKSFTQSSRTITRNGGSGLGLALCQQIIEAHNGHCHVKNNTNQGCTFSIQLPKIVGKNNE